MQQIRAIRGMPDTLPDATPMWQHVERVVAGVLASYAYREIRLPIVESTDLFCRSIGEVTDIVEKEMYTFDDRNGDSMTLRPEGTAGCVRAVMQNGLLNTLPQKLWYLGPMFRYERPQKGRQRQFHQVGVECFGLPGPDIDAEQICMTARLWRELGVHEHVRLELNTLGSAESRAAYRDALVRFLVDRRDALDEDSQRRLDSNPLRILDSKNPEVQALLEHAPAMHDHLDAESRAHFERLCALLDAAGIHYRVNQRLVRGLDYYCNTVFEWITESLGAQGTVCGGGRYDGLVEQLGGKPTPTVGFAMGLERLVLLMDAAGAGTHDTATPDVYWVVADDEAQTVALSLSEQLRNQYPGLRMQLHCGGGSLKSQMKKADRSGAPIALILAADECASQTVTMRFMQDNAREQQTVAQTALAEQLTIELTRDVLA